MDECISWGSGYLQQLLEKNPQLRYVVKSALNQLSLLSDRLQHLNAADFKVRAASFALISFANVLVGGLLYKGVSPSKTWATSLFKVYTVLFNVPGADTTDERTLLPTVVLNIIFFVGLIFFAVLLGMVGEEVATRVMDLRNGLKGKLWLQNHILILNWNAQALAVVQQLCVAQQRSNHPFHGRPIVVLADRSKEELDEALADLRAGRSKRKKHVAGEIYTRPGQPHRIQDLTLVQASQASIIILLYPEDAYDPMRAELLKAHTVAALSTLETFSKQQLIVQVPNEVSDNDNRVDIVQDLFATKAGGSDATASMHFVRLSEQSIVDRLVAQSSLQPGLCTIYESSLRHGKDVDWVFLDTQGISGRFADVRKRFPGAVACGFLSKFDGSLHLNPSDDDIMATGDKLVLLAKCNTSPDVVPHEEALKLYAAASEAAEERVARVSGPQHAGRRIAVMGWVPEQTGELVAGFSEFSPPGTHVTFIVSSLPDELHHYLERTLARSVTRAAAIRRRSNSSGGWGDARFMATLMRSRGTSLSSIPSLPGALEGGWGSRSHAGPPSAPLGKLQESSLEAGTPAGSPHNSAAEEHAGGSGRRSPAAHTPRVLSPSGSLARHHFGLSTAALEGIEGMVARSPSVRALLQAPAVVMQPACEDDDEDDRDKGYYGSDGEGAFGGGGDSSSGRSFTAGALHSRLNSNSIARQSVLRRHSFQSPKEDSRTEEGAAGSRDAGGTGSDAEGSNAGVQTEHRFKGKDLQGRRSVPGSSFGVLSPLLDASGPASDSYPSKTDAPGEDSGQGQSRLGEAGVSIKPAFVRGPSNLSKMRSALQHAPSSREGEEEEQMFGRRSSSGTAAASGGSKLLRKDPGHMQWARSTSSRRPPSHSGREEEGDDADNQAGTRGDAPRQGPGPMNEGLGPVGIKQLARFGSSAETGREQGRTSSSGRPETGQLVSTSHADASTTEPSESPNTTTAGPVSPGEGDSTVRSGAPGLKPGPDSGLSGSMGQLEDLAFDEDPFDPHPGGSSGAVGVRPTLRSTHSSPGGEDLSSSQVQRRACAVRKAEENHTSVNFTVGGTRFTFKAYRDPLCEEAMRAGAVASANAVVLGQPTRSPYPYSDAHLLSALLLIHSIVAEEGHKVHVVAKVSNANTKKVAKRFFELLSRRCLTFELLLPDQITSAVLTQTAWQPDYIQLVQELLVNSEGMELYIVETARLGFHKGDRVTFADVTEAARLLNYTALGYIKGSGLQRTPVMSPPADEPLLIEAEDRFIIMAEEWE